MSLDSDRQLLRAARAGEPAALGALIERHRAGMRAVALSMLGHRPEAEDVVQDAVVVALARIGELREPESAGPWLRAIVRNNCLMLLRARRVAEVEPTEQLATAVPNAEELLDGHALEDWIFHALDALSEPLRVVTLLRYFTEVSSYDAIAVFCGLPVGTVRSRLNEAKRKLGERLLEAASARHDDVRERNARHTLEAMHLLALADQGRFAHAAGELFDPAVEIAGPNRAWGTALPFLVYAMDKDRLDGVRQHLRNVVSGRELVIWEMDLESPAHDPTHCPPSIVWSHTLSNGRVRHLRLFHSAR
jgi:RNA polymerase sigma-70 factor (ECF subfamily)